MCISKRLKWRAFPFKSFIDVFAWITQTFLMPSLLLIFCSLLRTPWLSLLYFGHWVAGHRSAKKWELLGAFAKPLWGHSWLAEYFLQVFGNVDPWEQVPNNPVFSRLKGWYLTSTHSWVYLWPNVFMPSARFSYSFPNFSKKNGTQKMVMWTNLSQPK